jgi:hypothetical protein
MFRVKKEIYIDKRNFESISEVRSSIMNIVRQNYTEYNISSEAITFYVSGGFNFNRGMEGKVIINEDSNNYHITVAMQNSFIIAFLLFAFIAVMVMSNTSEFFDLSTFLYRLLLFPVFYSPFLLLYWMIFYISASAKLKTLADGIRPSL